MILKNSTRNVINSVWVKGSMVTLDLFTKLDIYRPRRSWGKVIFSETCVKNSVHRGVSASFHAGIHPPGTRGRHPPRTRGRHPPAQCMLGDTGGTHPTGRHTCLNQILPIGQFIKSACTNKIYIFSFIL